MVQFMIPYCSKISLQNINKTIKHMISASKEDVKSDIEYYTLLTSTPKTQC
jgi:hypothetical protein